jgi:hypothetical protein
MILDKLIKIKLVLVAGPGGARMDFVSGWLGKLPNFIDTKWYIDSSTGLSLGDMHFIKSIDSSDSDIGEVVNNHKAQLDINAKLQWAGSCHGTQFEKYREKINSGLFKLLIINTDSVSLEVKNKIQWEFFAKTYLSCRKTITNYFNNTNWTVDNQINKRDVTDVTRVNQLKKMYTNSKMSVETIVVPPGIEFVTAEYDKLFVAGGSEYLCNILGLSASERNHKLWNTMLEFADTPDSVYAFDITWTKSEFLNDKNKLL